MLWLPTVNNEVLKVATPLPLRPPVPRLMMPSKKVTVPPGVPPGEGTVAVDVTDCPSPDGFRLDDRAVEVENGLTVWVSVEEVLPPKLPLAPYWAVIGCPPRASELVLK